MSREEAKKTVSIYSGTAKIRTKYALFSQSLMTDRPQMMIYPELYQLYVLTPPERKRTKDDDHIIHKYVVYVVRTLQYVLTPPDRELTLKDDDYVIHKYVVYVVRTYVSDLIFSIELSRCVTKFLLRICLFHSSPFVCVHFVSRKIAEKYVFLSFSRPNNVLSRSAALKHVLGKIMYTYAILMHGSIIARIYGPRI